MDRRLVSIFVVSASVIAVEWTIFISNSFENAAMLGRSLDVTGFVKFMIVRTSILLIAVSFPAAGFVLFRVGVRQAVARTLVLICTVMAFQYVLRHIWRTTVPDAEIRLRTEELEYGPLFVGIALIPACCHLLFRKPFQIEYRPWIDAIISLVFSIFAVWFWRE